MPYKDQDKQREYQKKWCASRRSKYIEIYGGKCVKCGSTDRLQFDHIDHTKKISHRIWSWTVERLEAELAKCQILCLPCHQQKTNEDYGRTKAECGRDSMYRKGCRCGACVKVHSETNRLYYLRVYKQVKKARRGVREHYGAALEKR